MKKSAVMAELPDHNSIHSRRSWIDEVGGAFGVAIRLGGCLKLSLIVDMLDLSVPFLVALLSFPTIGCGSQHAQDVL